MKRKIAYGSATVFVICAVALWRLLAARHLPTVCALAWKDRLHLWARHRRL